MNDQIKYYENRLAYETDAWDLKKTLDAGENIIIIDVRSATAYQKEHIPGAINILHRTINEETTKQLDKSSLIVTYCDGVGCNASTKGALNMAKLGFRVKELMGGLEWWKRDGFKTDCGCE